MTPWKLVPQSHVSLLPFRIPSLSLPSLSLLALSLLALSLLALSLLALSLLALSLLALSLLALSLLALSLTYACEYYYSWQHHVAVRRYHQSKRLDPLFESWYKLNFFSLSHVRSCGQWSLNVKVPVKCCLVQMEPRIYAKNTKVTWLS